MGGGEFQKVSTINNFQATRCHDTERLQDQMVGEAGWGASEVEAWGGGGGGTGKD